MILEGDAQSSPIPRKSNHPRPEVAGYRANTRRNFGAIVRASVRLA